RGDLAAAGAALETAVDLAETPLDEGRAWLALGRVRRRTLERRNAREALEQARAILAGAPLWAAQVDLELQRLPIRRGAGPELTEPERRAADLCASGLTNREVAQALYISPKTVEATLGRVYRKLGIRSRAELGAAMGSQDVGNPP